jgi:hypothetical protein
MIIDHFDDHSVANVYRQMYIVELQQLATHTIED